MQFAGKPVSDLLRTLPLLYSVCATAQANAAAAACREALGFRVEPRIALAEEMLVCFETAREHLWRTLIDWPQEIDEAPDRSQLPGFSMYLAEAKQALFDQNAPAYSLQPSLRCQTRVVAELIERLSQTLEQAVFGVPAAAWQAMESVAELEAWIAHRATAAARYLARLMDEDMTRLGESSIAALPAMEVAQLHRCLRQPDADAFVAAPSWSEKPHETTPLTRQLGQPLIGAAASAYGTGLLTRLLARLVELAAIPNRLRALLQQIDLQPALPASSQSEPATGLGLGVVEAARGRLVHRVCLRHERVERYQILAPTEWNFHPQGVVAQGLLGLHGADESGLRRQASLFVSAVDPCVGHRIEIV
jgi:hypothetical protein